MVFIALQLAALFAVSGQVRVFLIPGFKPNLARLGSNGAASEQYNVKALTGEPPAVFWLADSKEIGCKSSKGPASGNRSGVVMATQPLTHHEIIGLIEPFARRDRHVDLAASDRIGRRLVFKPYEPVAETPALAGAREILTLENPTPEFYRLIRTVTLPGGAEATLQTDGPQPGELLAQIESVPPQGQFRSHAGYLIAESHRLEPTAGTRDSGLRMVLTHAVARLRGFTLLLKAETGRGYPAQIELSPLPDCVLELPDDVLAVLGWDWGVLRPGRAGWIGTLRARGREPRRSRRIETRLETAVAHLTRTLAEPPGRFHERLARARWAVSFRRTMPWLFCVALIAGAVALTYMDIPQESMLQMMVLNAPPVLMLLLFGMRELPRFEIPPVPRASTATEWRQSSPDLAGVAPNPDIRTT